MTKLRSIVAVLLVSGAITAIAAQPASATPINLYLSSLSFSYSGSGPAPKYADNGASDSTSNAGYVTTLSLKNGGYDFSFSGEGASLTPAHPLFVVQPQNLNYYDPLSSGTIQTTFGFNYDNTAYNLVEDVAYYANATTDYDSLIWQAGTNGTCTGSSITSSCTYDFSIAGQAFSIQLDNEKDWDMAEFDGASVAVAPVPEPASIALVGAGLIGLGFLWYRRRKTAATAA